MGWRADSDIQQMLRDSARSYLENSGGPAHFRAVRASTDGYDAAAWTQMAELGWTGILLPEKVGGSDLGLGPALTLAEECGRTIAPEPFVAGAVIAATVLAAAQGTAAEAVACDLATGARTATVAWQERRDQIDAGAMTTRLADGWLTGRKCYVPGWQKDAALIVAATGDNGPVVLLINPSMPGVQVTPMRMSDGTFTAEIAFNTEVPADAILLAGDAAEAALALALARGTVTLSAQLEGLAGALWQMTADYMAQRAQFGGKLSELQALRHRMVDLYAGIELSAASWRAAARAVDAGQIESVAVHSAKARCSEVALEMARWAIQYHGAFGYTDEADVGLFVNVALRWASWLGNPVTRRRAALTVHRSEGNAHG